MTTRIENLEVYVKKINSRENPKFYPIMATMCEVIIEQQKEIDKLKDKNK